MLPADCSRRLVAELQGALEACQKREKDLQQSLARCRVLLQPWEAASPPSPEPAGRRVEEAQEAACEPTPKDLKELELLTQALEKALRVRKGVVRVQAEESVSGGKAAQAHPGARPRTSNPKACVPARPPATSQRASSGVERPARAPSRRGRPPGDALTHAKPADHSAPLPSQGQVPGFPTSTPVSVSREAGAARSKPGPEQGKTQPDLRSEPFTLKEKGTQLQLPLLYKKIASRNASLWAQIQHSQFDADADVAAAKAHFLERMKQTFDTPGPAISPAQVQEEVTRLDRACHLLTQHLEETLAEGGEAAAGCPSLEQEYRRLVTLEGLHTLVDQHLLRLQELREAEEHYSGPRPAGSPPWGPSLHVRGSLCNTGRLSYSSTRELQTMAALSLRVAVLKQQIHLQEVLMEELLPLVGAESPQGQAQLALYRAIHSQLCEAGERFSVLVRDELAA